MERSDAPLRCLSAATAMLDLANGLDDDKSVLTGLFALELARAGGRTVDEQRSAFFAGLLRHLGCTAFAAQEARLADDDVALRRRLIHGDAARPADVVSAVAHASTTVLRSARGVGRLLSSARHLRTHWTSEACGAARHLARQLGFGPDVVQALDEVFEHWDGRGSPAGLQGEAISVLGRIAQAAHVTVVFLMTGGPSLAREVLELRSGRVLEPTWATAAIELVGSFAGMTANPERLEAIERLLARSPLAVDPERIAVVFGDVADLQSPFTRGHSRRVARACDRAAAALGLPEPERAELRLAAHMHDIGQVALPTGLWLEPSWTPADRHRGGTHTLYTERVLAAAPDWAGVAAIAAAHHERLDGSGTHRGLKASAIPRSARILAAADVVCALAEDRPHRPAMTGAAVRAALRQAVQGGHLDPDCVAAVIDGVGERAALPTRAVASLTARERDVLVELARGRTNKEIAASLRISARTVQTHTIHIYEKLGVNTRAAAALEASKAGLL